MKQFLMGNQYIALGAIDAGAASAYAYPGTPSSEILSSFSQFAPDRYAQWSVNEKIALELATAEAASGNRVLCAMKMVGLNVAADPFFSAAYTGVTGALVVVSADDPGPYSSQTEQDSRMYAVAAKVPVFDPAGPAHARALTARAFGVSASYGIPVMVRPVMRVCHSRQDGAAGAPAMAPVRGAFEKMPQRWAATPRYRQALHQQLIDKLKKIAAENMPPMPAPKNDLVVVASGYPGAIAADLIKPDDPVDLIQIDMPSPLAGTFIDWVEKNYKKILILEETFPVMENQFKTKEKILGKWNEKVPCRGEMTADIVSDVLADGMGCPPPAKVGSALGAPPPAPPRLCAGCGHRAAFYAIKRALPGGIYPGDIGCYTLGTNLKAVDSVLDMGASVTFAEAMKRANPDKHVAATIGDSTFFHSGLPAIVNARLNKSPIVVAVLDNATTAMTGFQPVPHEISDLSIESILEGIGIGFIESEDPYRLQASIALVRKASAWAEENRSPAVVIFRRPCVTHTRARGPFTVTITDACTDCGVCYDQFECPALAEGLWNPSVLADICMGCGVCVDVCPRGAIVKAAANEGGAAC